MRGQTRLPSITSNPIISLFNRQIIPKKLYKKELQKRASSLSLNSVGFQAILGRFDVRDEGGSSHPVVIWVACRNLIAFWSADAARLPGVRHETPRGWKARFAADYPHILDFFDGRCVRIFYVRQENLSDVKTGEGAETGKESRFKLMVI